MGTTMLKSSTGKGMALATTVASLMFLSQTASAVLLSPGSENPAVGIPTAAEATIDPTKTLTLNIPLVGISEINPASNLRELVVTRTQPVPGSPTLATGGLDFYFQITNSALSATDIVSAGFQFYTGFQTDLVYDTSADGSAIGGGPTVALNGQNAGSQDPSVFSRGITGSSVLFTFPPATVTSPGTETISPGQLSHWIVVRTNATLAALNGNAGIATSGATGNYTVYGPIPEPTTALFGAALVGMTAFRRTRRNGPVTA